MENQTNQNVILRATYGAEFYPLADQELRDFGKEFNWQFTGSGCDGAQREIDFAVPTSTAEIDREFMHRLLERYNGKVEIVPNYL